MPELPQNAIRGPSMRVEVHHLCYPHEVPYRPRPEPQEIETRAQAICKRIDKATIIWLPLFLLASFIVHGFSTVFMWTMITRMVLWPLLGVNPITGLTSPAFRV